MNNSFDVLVASECYDYLSEISYVFSEVAIRLSCCFNIHTRMNSKIDFHYGGCPIKDTCYLKFDARLYQYNKYHLSCFNNSLIWSFADTKKKSDIDLFGGIFRLLTMIDENLVNDSKRDKNGTFLVEDLPTPRAAVFDTPLVEYHTNEILNILKGIRPSFNCQKNIFNGFSHALLLTHDTDAVNLSSPIEILSNFTKFILRADKIRYNMFKDGLRNIFQELENNNLYGFQKWLEFTKTREIKSAFYLFVRMKVRGSINDCKSTVQSEKLNWNDLRSMYKDGYEFGLHPPINAKHSLDEFIQGKSFIEDNLGAPVFGLRHHYLALDWKSPYKTSRLHENAGFRYDLSIGWKDKVGFRAGTCLPFKPWDPQRRRTLDIYSIPLSIMDLHLMHTANEGVENKSSLSSNVINEVYNNNGVVVIDWHTESICNMYCYKNYINVLSNVLYNLFINDGLLFTTPFELIKIWHKRSRSYTAKIAS